MSRVEDNGGPYEVHCSGVIAKSLRKIQRQASHEGRGDEVIAIFRQTLERLKREPGRFGEPLYRLPVLRMEVRAVVVLPLVVHFALCEDHPLVFIKGVE